LYNNFRIKTGGKNLVKIINSNNPEIPGLDVTYLNMIDSIGIALFVSDSENTIFYVSPSIELITGYKSSELTGKKLDSIIYPEDQSTLNLYDYSSPNNDPIILRIYNKNKKIVSVKIIRNFLPDSNKSNRKVGLISFLSDENFMERVIILKKIEEDLRQKNEEMENELEYSQVLIKQLFPQKQPSCKFLKIDYRYLPLYAIGGDFFSFNKIPHNGFGVFLGDVSGHGVSSALFLFLLKSATDKISQEYYSTPELYMHKLNVEMYSTMFSHFLTAIYGYFTFIEDNVIFTFTKGGHPPPVLYKFKEDTVTPLLSKGKPVGMFKNTDFEEKSVDLNSGDRIFLYTDGMSETVNSSNQLLGYDGLTEIIYKNRKKMSSDCLNGIIRDLDQYREGESVLDDRVILCIEIK